MNRYEPLYVAYLYYFNKTRDYFECHEVLEELWLKKGKSPLYQGLLQIAVGLYHHSRNNINGACKLFRGAIDKLQPYPSEILGIDLGSLLEASKQYLRKLERIEKEPFDFYHLNIQINDAALVGLVEAMALNPPMHDKEAHKK